MGGSSSLWFLLTFLPWLSFSFCKNIENIFYYYIPPFELSDIGLFSELEPDEYYREILVALIGCSFDIPTMLPTELQMIITFFESGTILY